MLLWLEEASIEIAMILAVAIGAYMVVGAVWSLVNDHLHPQERREWRAAQQPGAPSMHAQARPATAAHAPLRSRSHD